MLLFERCYPPSLADQICQNTFFDQNKQLKHLHACQMDEYRDSSDQTLKKLIVKLAKYEKIIQARGDGSSSAKRRRECLYFML